MNHKVKHNLTRKASEKIRLVTVLKTQNLFPEMKTSRKIHTFVYIAFSHPPDNVLLCKNASSLPINYHFHVLLLLVNVKIPSEFGSHLVDLASMYA